MALLVASRPPVPQGQVTSTIYGHLREGRYDEAVQILEYELQVNVSPDHTADHTLHTQHHTISSVMNDIQHVHCFTELSNKQGSSVIAGICSLPV